MSYGKILSRIKIYLFILPWLLFAYIAALQVINWYTPPETVTIYRTRKPPYVAPEIKIMEKVPKGTTKAEIVVYKPTSRDLEAIQREVKAVVPEGDLAGVKKIDKLPYGGYLINTISPPVIDPNTGEEMPRTIVSTIVPKPPKFFEFTRERSIGVYAGMDINGNNIFNIEIEQELFRTGSFTWGAKAGVMYEVSEDNTNPYVLIGGRFTF